MSDKTPSLSNPEQKLRETANRIEYLQENIFTLEALLENYKQMLKVKDEVIVELREEVKLLKTQLNRE